MNLGHSDPRIKAGHLFLVLRILVATLIAVHGIARYWAGAVEPFGIWLDSKGIPFGAAVAYLITVVEIFGAPLLAFGRFVSVLCVYFAFVFFVGIVMVHAPEGWFVVGLGRNGMEYSVLLICCLLCLAYWHWDHAPRNRNTERQD